MVSSTGLLFLLLVNALTANAKFCAKCDGVTSPVRCINYAKCGDSEECYVEEKREFGLKTYKLGCLSSTVCQHLTPYLFGRSVNKRQIDSCVQCCSSDGCNTGLCKDNMFTFTTAGYPTGSASVWQESTTTTSPPTSYGGKTTLSSSPFNGYFGKSTTSLSSDIGVSCDFEHGMCQWYQDTIDDFNWIRSSGTTASSFTGPISDHTLLTNEGHYLYTEASSPRRVGDKARIFCPSIPAADAGCLQFWYSMYGSSMGSLSVMVNNKVLWTRSGNQGNNWLFARVNIKENAAFNISIQGTIGTGFHSDMAIDDITYSLAECVTVK